MRPAGCGGRTAKRAGGHRRVIGLMVCILCILYAADGSFAAGRQTVIAADKLEYFPNRKEYVATGSVEVKRDGAVIRADKIIYYEETSETVATGHFTYEDKETSIAAERAEINMDEKTGRLYNAKLLYKKDNYRLSARIITTVLRRTLPPVTHRCRPGALRRKRWMFLSAGRSRRGMRPFA
ncbi:MAG: LptA/OstA family protein [Candidatus Sulfobium sp.]